MILISTLFIGIDISSETNAVYFMNSNGSKYSVFSMQYNLYGAKTLSHKIVLAMSVGFSNNLVLGMEATSVYGNNLVCFIREDFAFSKLQKKIHVHNAKQAKKFKDAYSDLPRNDPVDAFVIADNLRFGKVSPAVYMDDYRYKALQNLTRARFFAVQNLTKEKQSFLNYLFVKFSSLT